MSQFKGTNKKYREFKDDTLTSIADTGYATVREEPKEELTPLELRDALMWVEDIMERCSIKFFVIGETGRQIFLNRSTLDGDKIELGIRRTDFTSSGEKMLLTLVKDVEILDNIINMKFKNVPIEVKIFEDRNKLFKNPDKTFFFVTNFNLPNPFEEYWDIREDLK